jgi:hypothetical protein
MIPERGAWVICDKCKLVHDATTALKFIHKHLDCVFNGLRIMPKDFGSPNRQRHYEEVKT